MSTDSLWLMLMLSTIVMVAAVATYLLLRRRRARSARRRLQRPAEFWQMKSRACEAQWSERREAHRVQ